MLSIRSSGVRVRGASSFPASTFDSLTVTGALNVDGAADFDSTMDIAGATTLRANTTLTTGVLSLPAGSVGAPSLNFSDAATGLYRNAANNIGIATNGALNFRISTAAAVVNESSFGGFTSTGMVIGTASGGTVNSNQDDYDWGIACAMFRFNCTGACNITSLTAGVATRVVWVTNVGTNNLTFVNAAATGTAANRILCDTGADLVCAPNMLMCFIYDGTNSRWRASIV